jgi:hypothetical protein
LTVDDREIPLRNYPRWDNPYTEVEFGTGQFVIEHDGKGRRPDLERNTPKRNGQVEVAAGRPLMTGRPAAG